MNSGLDSKEVGVLVEKCPADGGEGEHDGGGAYLHDSLLLHTHAQIHRKNMHVTV